MDQVGIGAILVTTAFRIGNKRCDVLSRVMSLAKLQGDIFRGLSGLLRRVSAEQQTPCLLALIRIERPMKVSHVNQV